MKFQQTPAEEKKSEEKINPKILDPDLRLQNK